MAWRVSQGILPPRCPPDPYITTPRAVPFAAVARPARARAGLQAFGLAARRRHTDAEPRLAKVSATQWAGSSSAWLFPEHVVLNSEPALLGDRAPPRLASAIEVGPGAAFMSSCCVLGLLLSGGSSPMSPSLMQHGVAIERQFKRPDVGPGPRAE
mmetsp:Transcript_49408/g.127508  ORF Transcript_49408/g.127508 Transcript_49408/m.127508 type:complete len:155 (-) Transcript_49408:699-1163(-)